MNLSWLYARSVLLVAFPLPIFSYLTLIYRELGRMTTGRAHEHLEIFEAEIEPKLKINRRSGGRALPTLRAFLLAFRGVGTADGGVLFVSRDWGTFRQLFVFLALAVVLPPPFFSARVLYRPTQR